MNKKIFIVIPGLNPGGVDKALIAFCNKYASFFDIDLLIFGTEKKLIKYLPKDVHILETTKRLLCLSASKKELFKKFGLLNFLTKCFYLILTKISTNKIAEKFYTKTYINNNKYDIAISWSNDGNEKSLVCGCEALVLNKISAKRKIVYMHNDYYKNGIFGKYNNFKLNQFNEVWCISKSVFDSLKTIIKPDKLSICQCFIDEKEVVAKSLEYDINFEKEKINLVSVCRLSYEKGIDRSLKIFSKIIKSGITNFHWYIVGGGDVSYYNKMLLDLGMQTYVTFIGERINPYPFVRNADAFILLSRFEGAPISIMEAKALGKKIIVTKYISADDQLSENDIVLENDEKSIECGLISFLKNPNYDNTGVEDIKKWNSQADHSIMNSFGKTIE